MSFFVEIMGIFHDIEIYSHMQIWIFIATKYLYSVLVQQTFILFNVPGIAP
jgi:hypothetical protein